MTTKSISIKPHNPPTRCLKCGEFKTGIPLHASVKTKACKCNK